MDDALGFLKQKLSQGLSDVEQWGSDAGNDVTHALGAVFGGSQNSAAAQQGQTATALKPQQTFAQPANPAIQLTNQNQQQTQPQPLKTNLFSPNQGSNINIAGQPQNLNTKLVNYQQPIQINPKGIQAKQFQQNNTQSPTDKTLTNLGSNIVHGFSNIPAAPINEARSLYSRITGNPEAARSQQATALSDVKNNVITGIGEVGANTVKGNIIQPAQADVGAILHGFSSPQYQKPESQIASTDVKGVGGAAAIPAYFLAKPLSGGNPANTQSNLETLGVQPGQSGLQRGITIGGESLNSTLPLGLSALKDVLNPGDAIKIANTNNAIDALKNGKAPDNVPDLTKPLSAPINPALATVSESDLARLHQAAQEQPPAKPDISPEDQSLFSTAPVERTDFLTQEQFNDLTTNLPRGGGLQAEQNLEEQLGPEAWNKLSQSQREEMLNTQAPTGSPDIPGVGHIPGMGYLNDITPSEAAVRVARGVKGRPGSFDQALKAYMNRDPWGLTKTLEESKAETSKALETAGVTPIGGTRGEYEKGVQQLGVKPLPVDKEADVVQKTKEEGNFVKLESLETRMSKQGAPGREMVQRATNARNEAAMLETRMRDGTPTFFKLNKADQAEAWLIKEGKVAPGEETSPEVMQAVQELKETMPKIQQDALSAGLQVGDRGATYMPHMYDKGFFNKPKNFAAAVKKLVKDGYADNTKDAIKLMNEYKNGDYMGGKVFSNLEKQREYDLPGYNMTDKELSRYYQGAAQRIAQAHQFGKDNEEITNLIDRANKNGQDGKALQETFNKYYNPDKGGGGVIDKAGNIVLKTTRILQLQKAAISHLPQGFANIGSKVGFYNYFKAVTQRVFSPEDQQFIHDAGFDAEANHNLSGTRGVAPGLKQVREFHRQVAGIGGKNFAEALASKGDEDGLKNFGVTGDLEKNADGSINLTDSQKVQAANFLADKTIFSNDPIQNPAFTQGTLGKYIGQYRTSYVFKQAGFINNLFKEAGRGNIAPLLRYVGVALPVSGALVTIGKDLFAGKNPVTQIKQNPKQQLLDVAQNSGGESAAGGLTEDAVNDAAYNYNADSRDQNIAGNIAPTAGTVVQTGQNIDNALRGNKTALVKQGLSYIPGSTAIENSRVGHALGIPLAQIPSGSLSSQKKQIFSQYEKASPSDAKTMAQQNPWLTRVITPQQQQFLNKWTTGRKQLTASLSPSFSESANSGVVKQDLKTREIANTFLDKDHNAQGQAILLNSQQKAANYAQLLSDPKAFAAVQKFEQSLPDHNPIWDSSDLKNYMTYESLPPGDPNRTVMEQKDPNLINIFNADSSWANKQNFGNNSVNGPGYIPYPPISSSQSQMMTQVDNLASIQNRTPAQDTQLTTLENNPDLQAAYSLLDNYTNSERTQNWGLQAIPYPSQNLTPQESALITQESALPSGTGQKTALIKANQNLWNQAEQIMGQDTIYDVEKYGGVVQQGGTEPDFLKDTYDAGQYDIAATKGANGSTSYSLNPALAYANQQAANAANETPPFVPLPKIKKSKKQSVKRAPKLKGFRAPHIKKATKVNVQANGRLTPTKVLHPTQVVKIK